MIFALSRFHHFMLMSDLNSEPTETFLSSSFMELYNFKDLAKSPTFFQNPKKIVFAYFLSSPIDQVSFNKKASLKQRYYLIFTN